MLLSQLWQHSHMFIYSSVDLFVKHVSSPRVRYIQS